MEVIFPCPSTLNWKMCAFVLTAIQDFACPRGSGDGYSVAFSLRAISPFCMALFLCVLFGSSGWVLGGN